MRSGVFALLFGLGAAACAAAPPPPSAPTPLLGKPAPELVQPEIYAPSSPLSGFYGRLVVVDFFADYCKPCRAGLPELQALHESRGDVAVIGVAEDPDRSVSWALVEQLGLDFPVIYDRGHALAGRYRVGDLPATFVVDRKGIVRWKTDRACQRSELEAVIDSLQ
jgi:cytochrome c biogenesis protein CcmG, thiol:disulfide interchange protein DsbE